MKKPVRILAAGLASLLAAAAFLAAGHAFIYHPVQHPTTQVAVVGQ